MPRPRPIYPEGMKKCACCKELKLTTEFSSAASTWDKLNSACKACALASTRRWLEKKKAAGDYEEVKRKRREGMKKWRDANTDEAKERHMKSSYGISWKEYAEMLTAQEGKCAICGTTKPGGVGRFHIDHCHNSKDVRGLLCGNCNTGLGKFKHLPHNLESAIRYLLASPYKKYVEGG